MGLPAHLDPRIPSEPASGRIGVVDKELLELLDKEAISETIDGNKDLGQED